MILDRQVTFWIVALVALVAVLWLLGEILLPFVGGMALAYLLNPAVNRLERLGVRRVIASLAIVGFGVLALVILVLLIAPIVGKQIVAFAEHVPGNVRRLQQALASSSSPWLQRLVGEAIADADKAIGDLLTQGVGWVIAFLKSLWSGGRALISIFSLVVVTPVVAFYMVYDWPRMIVAVDGWIPPAHRETVRELGREIDQAIAGFVRGQSAVCVLLGAFYAVALSLAGLNFGLLIGLLSGMISFIPFVGSMVGLLLALGVAFAQFWPDWSWILAILAIFLIGQFLEGYVLSPKLVGENIGLHPVWLLFALFAFGYLFGFVGLLLAVPMAAAAGVLVRFALRQYLASPFYTGEGAG
jgi:predicted PurR-regulated permease PerM